MICMIETPAEGATEAVIRQSYPGAAIVDGVLVRADGTRVTCPQVCQFVDLIPLPAGQEPCTPRRLDLSTMAEIEDVKEAERASRSRAQQLRRSGPDVVASHVSQLRANIEATTDPRARAALDRIARVLFQAYPGEV